MRRTSRPINAAAALAALLLAVSLVSGCAWHGLQSLPLPGTEGHGDGAYEVTIEMPNVSTIARNSRVRVDDVTVGHVSDITLEDGHARVTVTLDGGVALPANATAKIGQASLLGSPHVELATPVTEPARDTLRDGDVIPLARAGSFPTTEQTLASLSLVLGGGGLEKVRTISTEVNQALDGREGVVRTLLADIDELLDSLDAHREDIVRAIDELDRLSATVAERNDRLDAAIDDLAPALDTLAERRTDLTGALGAVGRFSAAASQVVDSAGDELTENLRHLEPVLAGLADSGDGLTESTRYLFTFPFPIDTYRNAVRGDYANGEVILDLRLPTLDDALLQGTPFAGAVSPQGGDHP